MEPVEMGKYEFIRLNMKERWVVLMPPDDPRVFWMETGTAI